MFKENVRLVLFFIGLMWTAFALDSVFYLSRFGIVPRTLPGLAGIAFAPILHGSVPHLLANTFSILLFGLIFSLIDGRRFRSAFLQVYLLTGFAVWLGARAANHIGASGVIFGLFGYLVSFGFFSRRLIPLLGSVTVLILYGSLVFGVLPTRPGISWESHLFGFAMGIFVAERHYRHV